MKVFVLGTRGFPGVQGGVEKHCEELYPRLVVQGAEITVCTRTPYIPRRERRKRWEGIRFIHLWSPKTKSLEAIIHTLIGVVIARFCSPDILHVHAVGPSICIPLAKVLGLKVVMTHHGPDYEREKWGRAAKSVLKLGEYLGIRSADRIIAISRGIAGSLKKRVRADERVFYIPNGVRIPDVLPAGETLRRLHLETRRYVFTACRFVPEKGLHDLIRAYNLINDPDFRLVIAGDADHENDYSRMIKQLARESSGVVLAGSLSGRPLQELFSHADLFVLASYYEGLPIVLLEALSYGLPVLASGIPQNREVALPESRYFEPGNVAVLAEKMAELFVSGIDQEEKERQRDYLTANHNWDILARQTYQVYRSVAGQDLGQQLQLAVSGKEETR